MSLFVGLISGTSMDAIDAALVNIDDTHLELRAFLEVPYEAALRERLEHLVRSRCAPVDEIGELNTALGHAFADAVLRLLAISNTAAGDVTAVGSHGQTIGHSVEGPSPYTLQIGDPNIIAFRTGIVTVADFRSKDVAAGGQGAPLVPGFHERMFRNAQRDLAVVNIGGIANVSLLARDSSLPLRGFDCGPGNTLMDLWIRRHCGVSFDENGQWAASGTPNDDLLGQFIAIPYFARRPPKSTGRELFHLEWLEQHLSAFGKSVAPADVQATLAELTVTCIVSDIDRYLPTCTDVIVCGGGARNGDLMRRLQIAAGTHRTVYTTDDVGLPAAAIEAITFAWLASRRLAGQAGNVPSVTGASAPVVLGAVYEPS